MSSNPIRPELERNLEVDTFKQYYYLKEELLCFCRECDLKISGSKDLLKSRVEHFLRSGKDLNVSATLKHSKKAKTVFQILTLESIIEEDFCCTQTHREFFKSIIGNSFHFSVAFQKYLKSNAGEKYSDAISQWYIIEKENKTEKGKIDSQFEYNRYIRDFFRDNQGRTLQDAIKCWKQKRALPGTNAYEKCDIKILY